MQRIGIAASKMAKGNLVSYNLYVILIACLFSFLVFLMCGFFILLVLFLISLGVHAVRPASPHVGLSHIFKMCLLILGLVLAFFTAIAIAKNLQLTKHKV